VVVAFDNDRAGEYFAWKIAEKVPSVTRVKPSQGKDWNDVLRGIGDGQYQPAVEEWTRIATAIGEPQDYVHRVTELVKDAKAGQPLSQKATDAMLKDVNKYRQIQNNLWTWHLVAKMVGKPEDYLKGIAAHALKFHAPQKPVPLTPEAMVVMGVYYKQYGFYLKALQSRVVEPEKTTFNKLEHNVQYALNVLREKQQPQRPQSEQEQEQEQERLKKQQRQQRGL
jgi:hypothetical protein